MRRALSVPFLSVLALLVLTSVAVTTVRDPAPAMAARIIPDQYIVTFKLGVQPHAKASEKARAYGLRVRHVYGNALRGFAATIPPGQLAKLQADPDILAIVPDRTVVAFSDSLPTGIRRSWADRNPLARIGSHSNQVAADVAVIDTGIDVDHPDLNVVGGTNCVPGETSYDDENGHGTHVAGTIGALDNGIGVVGVAPGVRLWAVRVLDAAGEGSFSDVICGVDWVTANADTIEVANMSLGGEAPLDSCTGGGLHEAICRSVAAGITYVVAAGNSAIDAGQFVPAAYNEVITVSAIVDTDGRSGGLGAPHFFYGADDTLAAFSNFGAVVDLAAPGVGIRSTYVGGGYATLDGTSMASPHVAGAAAIFLHQNPSAAPADVKSALLAIAWQQGSPDGFTGDVDDFPEPLLNAGAVGGDPLPPPPPGCTLSPDTGAPGSSTQVRCVNFGSSEIVRLYWDSTSGSQRSSLVTSSSGDGAATMTIPDATGGVHRVIAVGGSSGSTAEREFTVLPSLQLSASSGKVGSSVTATLKGFGASETVTVTWDGTVLKTGTTSGTGSASLYLTVPETVKGAHTVTATGAASGSQPSAPYTVIPGVVLSPSSGRIGTVATVNLRGFAAGETVTIRWADTAAVLATQTTSSLGSASVTITVPEASRGAHNIEGIGLDGDVSSATFSVFPSLVLQPASGTVGTSLVATLRGFGADKLVTVRWYDTTTSATAVASAVMSANGSGAVTFPLPMATKGSHRVEAIETGTTSGPSVYVTVNPSLSLSPAWGEAGIAVTATVNGFSAGEPISIKWYTTATISTVVATTSASSNGNATVSFSVPEGAPPETYTVEAVGSSISSKALAMFLVGSGAPQPVPATAYCTLAPGSGPVGSSTRVTCANFSPSESVRIYWDTTATSYRASFIASTSGSGSALLTIPDAPGGEHRIIARGMSSGAEASEPFTVTPNLVLSATSGKVGSFVNATLKGFGSNEAVSISWGDETIKTGTTSASGGASLGISVPERAKGMYAVNAEGATSALTATATFSVVPSLALSPSSGRVGTSVTVSLRGYSAGEAIAIRWYDSPTTTLDIASAVASSQGSASISFPVPEAARGTHTVDGVGSNGSIATAPFTIWPQMTLSATAGAVGTALTATITGFTANEDIAIRWYDTASSWHIVTTATSSSQGSASVAFEVPEGTNGVHRVEAFGVTSQSTSYQYFSVRAALVVSPVSGPGGISTEAILTGYRAGETITIRWYQTTTSSLVVTSATATSLGSASVWFQVPADATAGDHKVEGVGGSSAARASANFSVVAGSSGSGAGQQAALPPNTPVHDDFSASSVGSLPAGWSVASSSSASVTIATTLVQGNAAASFVSHEDSATHAILIKDGALFDQVDLRVRVRMNERGNEAGIIIAWSDKTHYIAIVADEKDNAIEVREVVDGTVRTHFTTGPRSVRIRPGVFYWLRAEAGQDDSGTTWISLYWSTDGSAYQPLGSAVGFGTLAGGIGLVAAGSPSLSVDFDDVSAVRSSAHAPVMSQPTPTEEPRPTSEQLARETATPTPSPEASPSLTPSPEETGPTVIVTPEPVPDPETVPTLTPEPIATQEPTVAPEPEPTATPTAAMQAAEPTSTAPEASSATVTEQAES